jgi:hypothetical protein
MTDTLRNLDDAIQAHIANAFEGAITDAWVLVCHSSSLDAHTVSNYRIVTPDVQPIHTDAGLVEMAKMIIRDSWDNAYDDEDDD